jgi:hypothetical protein
MERWERRALTDVVFASGRRECVSHQSLEELFRLFDIRSGDLKGGVYDTARHGEGLW